MAVTDSLEEKLRAAKRLAPHNLGAHAWLLHRDDRDRRITAAAHHQVMAAVLQDPERFPYVVIVCPPGYAKSTWGSIIYPAWRLGSTGGRVRMGLISNTATQAEGFARAVQQVVEGDHFAEVYPDAVRDPNRKWTNREMYFRETPQGANPALMAMGMDGPILGKRFDEIIIDDPTTWAQARSETIMEEQRNKLLNTIIQRFPAGSRPPTGDKQTRMVVLMTRYGERDLLPNFRQLGFYVLHMPAMGYWDRTMTCPECGLTSTASRPCEHYSGAYSVEWGEASLWPEKEPRAALEQMREHDQLIFELVYQGNTSVLSGDVFDPGWWKYAPTPRRFDLVVMGVDTAGGRDAKKGDYTAIVVIGLRGDQVHILHVWRDRLSAPAQEAKIVEVYRDMEATGWRPSMVFVEDANEGRAVYDHLIQESRLPLKAVKPVGDKTFRAVPLANTMRRGGLWLPDSNPRWVRPLQAEFEAFPEGSHDDMVDAVTLCFNETSAGGARGPRLRTLG